MNTAFFTKLFGNQPVKVAFIGDSITQGFYAAGAATGTYCYTYFNNPSVVDDRNNPALHSFVNLFRQWVTGKNGSSTVLNKGLESSYAAWHVSNNTAQAVISWGATACFISLGLNDCMAWDKSINQFKASMQTMITALKNAGIEVILVKENQGFDALGNLPVATVTADTTLGYYLPTDLNQKKQLAYVWGNQFVKSVDELGVANGLPVLDLWNPFNDAFTAQGYVGSGLMYDVVHPNETGHALCYSTITAALAAAQAVDVTGLSATGGVNSVALSWNYVPAATGYKVYRSENGGSTYTLISTQVSTSFTDRRTDASSTIAAAFDFTVVLGLEYGKTYTYKVTAYNALTETPGATASATPIAELPYTSGTTRGKGLACLIVVNTDHAPQLNCTMAQVATAHDFLRSTVTTKITLMVSRQILFATSGEILNILNYLKNLVASYDYDIVTLPHLAWFPTTSRWSQGLPAEIQNIIDCHNKCYQNFGKYPVAAQAYHYSKNFQDTLISLGYKLSCSGFREQWPTHPDGWGSLGFPYHFYRPSKNNALVPGGGSTSDTFNIVSGLIPLQSGPYRSNGEPATGKNNATSLGCADAYPSLVAQQKTLKQMLEDSQSIGFNQFHFVPLYFDPYWLFNDNRNGTVATTGEKEIWYMQKQLAIWMKQRYSGVIDFLTATELSNFVDQQIPLNDPHPPYCLLSYVEQEGWLSPNDKQIRYDCQNYSTIVRHKSGSGGYVRNIQHIPYSPATGEPSFPNSNWNISGGWYRSNSTDARVWSFMAGSVTGNLSTGANCTIHGPVVVSDNGGRSVTLTWDIYNAADTLKLLAFQIKFAPQSVSAGYTYKHSSVTTVTEQNNLLSTTTAVPFVSETVSPPAVGAITAIPLAGTINASVSIQNLQNGEAPSFRYRIGTGAWTTLSDVPTLLSGSLSSGTWQVAVNRTSLPFDAVILQATVIRNNTVYSSLTTAINNAQYIPRIQKMGTTSFAGPYEPVYINSLDQITLTVSATTTLKDIQKFIDSLTVNTTASIIATETAKYPESLTSILTSNLTVLDYQKFFDTLQHSIQSSVFVTDSIYSGRYEDTVLIAPSIQTFIEDFYTAVNHYSEDLVDTSAATTSVSDLQHYVDSALNKVVAVVHVKVPGMSHKKVVIKFIMKKAEAGFTLQ